MCTRNPCKIFLFLILERTYDWSTEQVLFYWSWLEKINYENDWIRTQSGTGLRDSRLKTKNLNPKYLEPSAPYFPHSVSEILRKKQQKIREEEILEMLTKELMVTNKPDFD